MDSYFMFLFAIVLTAATMLTVAAAAFFLFGIYKAIKKELFDR